MILNSRSSVRFLLAFAISTVCFFTPKFAHAKSSLQDTDPESQCTRGLQLFTNGRATEALPFLESGFGEREGASFSDPDDLAICALALGLIYDSMSRYADALDADFVALGIFRKSGNRMFEGITLNNIGRVYSSQNQYADALEQYQQALAIARTIGDRASEGRTLNNIGGVYDVQGHYVQALEYFQQSLIISKEVGDRTGEGTILSNIGAIYHSLGKYAQALAYFQRALVIVREVGDRIEEGKVLNNIGRVHDVQGQIEQSLDYYQQALTIFREVNYRKGEGDVLSNIGAAYGFQDQYAQALEYHQQALAIRREVGDRAGEGITLHNIGFIYGSMGEYAKALEHYQQALEIKRETGNRTGEGTTLSNIGWVYDAQGRYSQALDYYHQALAIRREVGDQAGEGLTLSHIGWNYYRQRQYVQALEYYQLAIDRMETLRMQAGTEQSRAGFISQYMYMYDDMIQLAIQESESAQAFYLTERGRARAFLDSMSTGYIELNDNSAAELYTQEQVAFSTRRIIQENLANAKSQNSQDRELINELERKFKQADSDYQTILDDIAARGDQLIQLVPGRSTVLDLQQSQALLDTNTTLLSFWILEDQTMVFILTQNSFDTVSLPVSQNDLYSQIKSFRNFDNINVSHPQSAVALHHTLIDPLLVYLKTSNLIIIPHGELHYLPFAALTDGSEYLIDKFTISYLPSISAWPYIIKNTENDSDGIPLILGNPDIELSTLPFAENEARAVASILGTSPLLNQSATESVIHEKSATIGILHLAVHGSYNRVNPLYSTLYLTPDQQDDGLLEVHEIYGLDLSNSQLVVLSACDTQMGELSSGDELVGLTRAFLFAGAPSVMASLWEVDDRATQLLMEKFYANWRAGMSQADGLRQAQIELRKEYPNPYYWAAFVLSGEDGGTLAYNLQEPISQPDSGSEQSGAPICGSGLFLVGFVLIQTKRKGKAFRVLRSNI